MTNKPSIIIEYAPQFRRDLKRLGKKKRPNIQRDLLTLLKQLVAGETPGDHIQGVGYPTYKVRLRSSDLARGKSGGYRVIYYVNTPQRIILITLYLKSEQVDISPDEIRRMIDSVK